MRQLVFMFSIIGLPFLLSSQSAELELQIENGIATLQKVVEVPGTKDDLFTDARQWLFDTYRSGKAVLELEDKEEGVIIGNGKTGELIYNNVMSKVEAGNFRYSIKLEFKPGKYRLTFNDIYYERGELNIGDGANYGADYPDNWPRMGKKHNKRQWESMKAQALKEFNLIAENLYTYLTEKPEADDDW